MVWLKHLFRWLKHLSEVIMQGKVGRTREQDEDYEDPHQADMNSIIDYYNSPGITIDYPNPEHFDLTKEFEGYSKTLYKCPADKWTIGWGRNIEDRGISKDEAELMFRNDINNAIRDLAGIFPNLRHMERPIRIVLVDMMFNMGLPSFRKFKRFIAAAKRQDKPVMVKEMKDSAWYAQVGNRSKKLIELLLTPQGGTE